LEFIFSRWPLGETRDSLVDVPSPVIRLSKFAVADDVYARFGLLPDYLRDGFLQACGVRSLVIGSVRLDFLQEGD
jgi:hypothetical protein